MAKKALLDIGLTAVEADVYLSLLEIGSTTAGAIVKKTGLHRATVYTVIQRLIEQGLVHYVMKVNHRFFQATDPDKFLDVIREKEESVKKALPKLRLLKELGAEKQHAAVYEGSEGVKSVYDMMARELKSGDVHMCFGAPAGRSQMWIEYFDSFSTVLNKKGVSEKIIFNEDAVESIAQCKKRGYDVRVLPKEYLTPTSVDIFGNKTAFVIWTRKPVGFVVDSKEFAGSFRNYFELLWGIAREV